VVKPVDEDYFEESGDPVLVDGARPLQQQLPPELLRLARLNALELSFERYQYDVDRLLDLIGSVLTAASGTGTAASPRCETTPVVLPGWLL
jgi:hypothetical protein